VRAFNFKQGKEPWDSGTLLHWYVEVDWDDPRHDALAQLVTDSNQALLDAGFPVTPIEHRWLHITVVINSWRVKTQVERWNWSLAC
jgi:hypothetical protein